MSEINPAGVTLRRETLPAVIAGGILIVGGLVTAGAWAVAGGAWDAAVSWRKPTLFCFASGVTCLSLAWVGSLRRPRRFDLILFLSFGVAIVAEVALITLQQARGVPSHFNTATAFDAAILRAIQATVGVVTVIIAVETWRSFGDLSAGPAMRFAVRAGMLLLLLACLIGFAIEWQGERELAAGRSPQTYGEAGVMKFPHGVPLHAIQTLPFVAWAAGRLGFGEKLSLRVVKLAAAATVATTFYAVVQTLLGLGRFEPAAAAVVAAAAGFLATYTLPVGRGQSSET